MAYKLYVLPRPDKRFGFEVGLYRELPDGKLQVFELVAKEYAAHGAVPWLMGRIIDNAELRDFLQAFANAAAEQGVIAGDGTAALSNLRAHLEDMRALVFDRPKPGSR